mgnify:CR=1 FL=1
MGVAFAKRLWGDRSQHEFIDAMTMRCRSWYMDRGCIYGTPMLHKGSELLMMYAFYVMRLASGVCSVQ